MATAALVAVDVRGGTVGVTWSDGVLDEVTPLWLRHACHCTECLGTTGTQRHVDPADLDSSLAVRSATLDGGRLIVELDDGHRALVPGEQLRRRIRAIRPDRWDHTHAAHLRSRAAAIGDDLASFLVDLDRDGVALLTGLPATRGTVLDLAARIGYVRETNYGRSFDVAFDPAAANLANSTLALPVHTDNPYRDPVPSVQLLHCIRAGGDGGLTRLVDGFAAAERLAAVDREAFDLLATVDVPFRYADADVDLRARGRLVEVDARGEVVGVRVNSRSMQPPDLATADLDRFYAAYRAFTAELGRPEWTAEVALHPGDLLAFDNRRTLHGRSAFRATEPRLLEGCYVDIDAVRSAVLVGSTQDRAGAGDRC